MGAGFYANRDSKLYQLRSVTGESISHNKGAASFALRFRLKTLTGTSQVAILSNGYFEIRRTSGTAATFELFWTNASASTTTTSLGVLAVDTDYVVTFRGTAVSRTTYLNGSSVGVSGITGNTWNPGAAAKWTLGPASTAIDVEIYEFAYWDDNITAGETTNLNTMYFDDARATNIQGYHAFNVEYYGTFNESDGNSQQVGLSASWFDLEPVISTAVGSWTGDDPIVDVADIDIEVDGTPVADGGSINLIKFLHQEIDIDLINSHVSNSGTIVAVTYSLQTFTELNLLDQQFTVANSDTETQSFLTPILLDELEDNLTLTITFHGKGRIFNQTDCTYSITLNINPSYIDRLLLVQQVIVTHIVASGSVTI